MDISAGIQLWIKLFAITNLFGCCGGLNRKQQRVYVPGAKEEEDALEFDVYNQGMIKTELCNKWEETGACPYGENCQFAHGIKELRPVIRHPRYKTEVCRMVLAGDVCPYGHRCHFRHSLTEEERLMAAAAAAPLRPPPPRWLVFIGEYIWYTVGIEIYNERSLLLVYCLKLELLKCRK